VAVAFKLALRDLPPPDLVALATFVSWVSLAAVLLFRRIRNSGAGIPDRKTEGTDLLKAGLLGLLNPLAYYWILFAAYDRLPAQAAQPLNYTWPIFLALLAAPMAGRKPSVRDFAGLLISLIGVILISRRPGESAESLDSSGIVLALGSGVIWAFYWLAGTGLKMDGTLRLFTGFTTALPILGIIWLRRGLQVPVTGAGWISLLWVGLFEMGITFMLWNGALESTKKPARIGNLVYLGPFISLLWIAMILGESIRPATVGGLAVIIAGILTGQSRRRIKPTHQNQKKG
jgi:drug/metabolite transporter (DMT)-like permease